MAKILILANNDVGLYKFRKELLIELVEENEVYISLPYGDYIPQLEELGCIFINTSISRRGTNPVTDLKLLMKYRQIIKNVKPDVVLTYTIKPNVYGGVACRLAKIPYIANVTGLGTAVEKEGILQKITLNLYKSALKKASCVFMQNKENEDFFKEKRIIRDNSRLIPGSGVNLEEYSLLKYPSDKEINFLFIARVMKEKGIDQYLEAAKYIKKKYSQTVFHVLGFCEQEYTNKLERMEELGIIKYHGMQKNVRKFHAISHCTIHPSYYPEGMSNVLLEAAASGRPIITTDRNGCREIVDNKVSGYIIEQKSTEDLIKKIEEFLKLSIDMKMKMGIEGRKKVEKEFNRSIIIHAYIEEINEVLISKQAKKE
ncbi:N, N'-diacetylbacillosaminyl-diphospho-undecaprenol alpha-1,3-N-acetylgalactosaminyltransferase [Planococcus massiliensis]|uniref:N, N'-diacetylbacillosaminyl-diphospho-undecaprenol alpha-1,3-N-acetylgalactosaminyltransferase n=1 Tax=Planococcus massiliensis TaxID=1499687 RepID=A0A098EIC9_9BACL|nr:glycosyltransferase family 4 protein [Planococcus massiliensis]CEG22028.1 N, N'-diacetylbacillosaminyl-diphospho-undecaprenol alpha-1,3-N-acetylgalactosaminyltransferase [Planococcus massiliensis]